MIYNLTQYESGTNLLDQFLAINAAAKFIPAHMILLCVFVIALIMLIWSDAKSAFLAASAFTSLTALGLFVVNAINQITLITCIVTFFISIIVFFVMKD